MLLGCRGKISQIEKKKAKLCYSLVVSDGDGIFVREPANIVHSIVSDNLAYLVVRHDACLYLSPHISGSYKH